MKPCVVELVNKRLNTWDRIFGGSIEYCCLFSKAAKENLPNKMDPSALIQLQMEELLSEVRVNYEKQMTRVQHLLRKLKNIINGISDRGPLSIHEADRIFRQEYDIAIPFPALSTEDTPQVMLEYAKPMGISIVGSYARQTCIKSKGQITIDLVLFIPPHLLQDKDYLDHQYFVKRAYYVACIAAGIRDHQNENIRLCFEYQNDCSLQPVLIMASSRETQVKSKDNEWTSSLGHSLSNLNSKIRMLATTNEDVFPVSKTWPWKTSVRSSPRNIVLSKSSITVTQLYNGTLRADCSIEPYSKFLQQASADSKSFQDACILGSLWLRQRNLGASSRRGGFGGFECAIIMYFLTKGDTVQGLPTIPKGHNSFQLFRAFLKFISSRNLILEPWTMHASSTKLSLLPSSGIPVFFDGLRGLNILYKMSPWSYSLVSFCSSHTFLHIPNLNLDSYDTRREQRSAFWTDLHPTKFVYALYLRLTDCCYNSMSTSGRNSRPRAKTLLTNHNRLEVPQDWNTNSGLAKIDDLEFCTKAHELLTKALNTRIRLVHPLLSVSDPWALSRSGPSLQGEISVTFGFLINAEQMAQVVERGPPAEDREAAAAFRKFWGEKAELRRFKDGSILESLLWMDDMDVLKQIVIHVIRRHLGEEVARGLHFMNSDFDAMLPMQVQRNPSSLTHFRPLQKAYSTLETQICELKDIPLHIRRIAPACADLRYTSVIPQYTPRFMIVILQFEGSSRWPDDIFAIQRTKTALLLRIAELLDQTNAGLITKVGVQNSPQTPFLEIVYPNNAAFQLLVHHDREETLLERQSKDGSTTMQAKNQASTALASFKRDFIQAPLHTQTISTLCTRFPAFSASARLVKQWCNSHLLSPHFSEEFIELLTANTFVHPQPWQAPGTIQTGFLRTLAFVARWDWRSEPLIVDFSGSMTFEERDAIKIRLEAWRKMDPAMNKTVLFAASNIDPDGITWTERGPVKVVAARFTSLARAAIQAVEKAGFNLGFKSLFNHSTSDYDFIIHLDQKVLGRTREPLARSSFKNITLASTEVRKQVNFDPVQLFVQELGHEHGESMVLFYNPVNPSFIAGLWTAKSVPRSLKPNLAFSTMPSQLLEKREKPPGENGYKITINHPAALGDIARLGGDMVLQIETRN